MKRETMMDAKLTEGPWFACVREPHAGVDGAHYCQIGLSLYNSVAKGVTTLGYRRTPAAPENEYLAMSGICRPADAVAMAAAGEMLAALVALESAATAIATKAFKGEPVTYADLFDAINPARAAITKATTIPAVSTAPETTDGAA